MGRKTQGRWIVTLLLVAVLACIAGLTVMFAYPASAEETEEKAPVYTYYLGCDEKSDNYHYVDFASGWSEAVRSASIAFLNDKDAFVKVILEKDWIADPVPSTGFGKGSGNGFSNGRISLLANSNITIDLNGHTIDRNLYKGAQDNEGGLDAQNAKNGQVFYVLGNLTVISSKEGGKITGGYGGVLISSNPSGIGTFNLYGGSIEGNKAFESNSYGGGVYVSAGSTFNMYGGYVQNNIATYGGGVCVAEGSTFNMYGGYVQNNQAVGGSDNYGGGGICVFQKGNVNINDGEICGNVTDRYGAGICVLSYSEATINLNIGGGKIHRNVAASLEKSVAGGGVAILRTNNNQKVIVNAKLGDGVIEHNTVIANYHSDVEAYRASGAGVYSRGAVFTVAGGEIAHNVACGFKKGANGEVLNNVIKAYIEGKESEVAESISTEDTTYGGGLYTDGGIALSGGSIHNNQATRGSGVYLASDASVTLSGNPVIKDNYSLSADGKKVYANLQVTVSESNKIKIAGKLEDGALMKMLVNSDALPDTDKTVTVGYGEHNSKLISFDSEEKLMYANPNNYFAADEEEQTQYLLVLKNGELGVFDKPLKLVVVYSDGSSENIYYGNSSHEYNYIEYEYGSAKRPVAINAPEVPGTPGASIAKEVGIYTLTLKTGIGNAEAEFSVVVKGKDLTDDNKVSVEVSEDNFIYDGEAKIPSLCVVKYNGTVLKEGTDYTLSYENNIEIGTSATVIVHFKGNYSGEARANFTIYDYNDPAMTAVISWQANVNGSWTALTDELKAKAFTYNATDQSDKIRAVLTVKNSAQYAYAYGAEESGLYVVFNGDKDNKFENAGSYTLKVVGNGTYKISDNNRTLEGTVVMNKLELALSASDFKDYAKTGDQRLWQLQIGSGADLSYSHLLDYPTYVDPGASVNDFGERVTTGTLADAYARYRGKLLSVILDSGYTLANGMTVEQLYDMATITYTPGSVGRRGAVSQVKTTVTITFDDNYIVGTSNKIEFTKTWYIVTIANTLLMEDGKVIPPLSLTGWKYANPDDVKVYTFRPEHGNTVIYTYYSDNKVLRQFALVYSDDTSSAVKQYYEVKKVNGNAVADTQKPINDDNYIYTYNYNLEVGTYRIDVTIPQSEAHTGPHTHWWENDAIMDDFGTVYYEFTYQFSLTVDKYSVSKDNGANAGIRVVAPENRIVVYNGKQDNLVKPESVWLFDMLLVEGKDYTLSSKSVNAGRAEITIHGIGSLEGEFTIPNWYTITKAHNGWQEVPYIMYWTYRGYNKEVNRIKASPIFLDDLTQMWFAIALDEAGDKKVEGLERFSLDEKGLVSSEVEKILKDLPAETYYLIGQVEGTGNYYALEHQIIPFTVFTATNSWEITPSVNSWTEGKYGEEEDRILLAPLFGTAHVRIENSKGEVFYDSDEGIDRLSEAKAGNYTLTAYVDGSENYSGLDIYTVMFQVFKKPGLSWWAVLLIVAGALGLAALVIFILWKNGVFRIVTDKILVSIRTRVSVEATIASVRAAKMMEEGRKSVEEAKRREEEERLRKEAEANQAKTPDEGEKPEESEKPAEDKKPEEGEKPIEDKKPEESEKPEEGKKPQASKKPAEGKKVKSAPKEISSEGHKKPNTSTNKQKNK